MSNPYEVEHNIKQKAKERTRRPSMSSFFAQLSQVETPPSQNNPHATPTPVEYAGLLNLLQDQFASLQASAPSQANADFLASLISSMEETALDPPSKVAGVPQSYLDELERVPKQALKKTDSCPICGENFLDDPYPLVVELPCHTSHRFDLDCVGPWLRLNGTCPMDRKELLKKKEPIKQADDDEEDYDEMFA